MTTATTFFQRHAPPTFCWVLLAAVMVTCIPQPGPAEVNHLGAETAQAPPETASTTPAPPPALLPDLFAQSPWEQAGESFRQEQWQAASQQLAAALQGAATHVEPSHLEAYRFALAYALLKQDQFAEAQTNFAAVVELNGPLRDYAAAFAAESAFALGDFNAATQWAGLVRSDALIAPHSRAIHGLSEGALGQWQHAIDLLQPLHAELPQPWQRRALLALANAQSELELTQPAAENYRTLQQRWPSSAEAKMAAEKLEALRPKLPTDFFATKAPPPADPYADAMRLYNAHRSEQAIAAMLELRKKADPQKQRDRWCDLTFHIGKSHTKLREHAKALTYYDEAINHCDHTDWHIKALYTGGSAAWNAGQQPKAIQHYRTIIDRYATHSYADDAYLFIARIHFEQKRTDDAIQALNDQLAAYPDGDMAKDAHWLLFQQLYTQGQWREAIAYVDRHGAHAGEDDLYSMGRLAYFQARALEQKGDKDAAVQAFLSILDAHPLTYYASLSLSRLHRLAPKDAQLWVQSHRSRPIEPHLDNIRLPWPEIAGDPAFQRGSTFLALGLHPWGKAELQRLRDAHPEDPTFAWLNAALYQQAHDYLGSHRMAAQLATSSSWFTEEGRRHWALAYPRPFWEQVKAHGDKHQLPTELVYAIMREESAFNPAVESWANARGLMQLMLPTARSTASSLGMPAPNEQDLFKPPIAIALGVGYLAKLASTFAQHPTLIIAGYNGGQGNVGRWLRENGDLPLDLWVEMITFGQTRNYAKRVSMTYWRYCWLYDQDLPIIPVDPAQKPPAQSP